MILTNFIHSPLRATEVLNRQSVTSTTEFRQLEKNWEEIFEACPEATPFNSWEWLFSWWQAYGDKKTLSLLVWREAENQRLVGIAPLYLSSEKFWPGLWCKVLRFLGDGSFDSDYLNFLIHPDYFDVVIADFFQWLGQHKVWDVVVFDAMPSHSCFPDAIEQWSKREYIFFRRETLRCSMAFLPDSFDEFLSQHRPRFRTKLRSLLRSFDTINDFVFETGSSNLKKRLRSLFSLHEMRWQKQGQPGVFVNKKKRLFYSYFVPRFARKGWLRFYSLRVGSQYLAHEMCFGKNGQTLLLQEGFDIANEKASYGQMLRAIVFRSLIEQGEKVYDFLGGYSDHKADWGAVQKKMAHVILAKKNWKGAFYFNAPIWREALVTRLKRIVPEKLQTLIGRNW